jgi:recombination protein RecT
MSTESPDKTEVVEQAAEQLAQQPLTLGDSIRSPKFKAALQDILPRAMRPERFVRLTLNAMLRTPDLTKCTRASVFRSLLDLSMYGLEPDGKRAHLIPYKNHKNRTVECQLIIDYKGLADLVRRSGAVRSLHADAVYPNDEVWDWEYGTNHHLRHKPALANRGPHAVAYYSWVQLPDGTEDFIVLNPAEVEKVRKSSKMPDEGPWKTHYDDMGIKTAFRRHSKWLPLTREVRDAVERDDEAVDASGWEELAEEAAQAAEPQPEQPALKPNLRDKLRAKQAEFAAERAEPAAAEEKPPGKEEDKW